MPTQCRIAYTMDDGQQRQQRTKIDKHFHSRQREREKRKTFFVDRFSLEKVLHLNPQNTRYRVPVIYNESPFGQIENSPICMLLRRPEIYIRCCGRLIETL